MDRKKLIYNVIQDVWKLANLPQFQKAKSEMTDEDWAVVVQKSTEVRQKYTSDKLSAQEREFAFNYLDNMISLIDRSDKELIEIQTDKGKIKNWVRTENDTSKIDGK